MTSVISIFSLTGLLALFAGCSGLNDLSAKKDEAASEEKTEVAAAEDPCSGEECETKEEESSFGTLGLAEHCAFAKEDAKGCFVCTPRELPRKICVDVDADFDPAKSCCCGLRPVS